MTGVTRPLHFIPEPDHSLGVEKTSIETSSGPIPEQEQNADSEDHGLGQRGAGVPFWALANADEASNQA